jgi:uncharacterized protein YdeI (YjbR/CyaY-like superfamily)
MTNGTVDEFLEMGCGRCALGGTPECKVHPWRPHLELLRHLALDCGLDETLKWGVPCYTFQGANVAIVAAFKEYCSVSFFKGALLQDTASILEKPGEHTQAARLVKFTDVAEIHHLENTLKQYLYEAIELEKAGLKFEYQKQPEPMPEEILEKMAEAPAFKVAFEGLTPGRRRGYILLVLGAKQAATRRARVEKIAREIIMNYEL